MKCKNCGDKVPKVEGIIDGLNFFCSLECRNVHRNGIIFEKTSKKEKTKVKKKTKTPKSHKTPKTPKYSTLVDKLDSLLSKYIRQKYADKDGNVLCVSCNNQLHWKDAHNCHWVNRGVYRFRWDEDNLMPGCPSCNVYRKEFHIREYTMFQIKKLGKKKVDEMRKQALEVYKKPSKEFLLEKIAEYEAKNSLFEKK